MKPIEKGMKLLNSYLEEGYRVEILSAYGDSDNIKEIEQAKRDWVVKHISKEIKCKFVDKVQNKYIKMDKKCNNILIDDRKKAIDAWQDNGGIGILFVEY